MIHKAGLESPLHKQYSNCDLVKLIKARDEKILKIQFVAGGRLLVNYGAMYQREKAIGKSTQISSLYWLTTFVPLNPRCTNVLNICLMM